MLVSVALICVGALLEFGSVSGSGIVFGSGSVSGSGSEVVTGSGSDGNSGSGSGAFFGSVQLSSSLLSRQSDIPSHLQLSGMQGDGGVSGWGVPPWTDSWASPGSPSRHSNSASEHLHQCRY